jgi:hypothetical protein
MFRSLVAPDGTRIAQDLADAIIDDLGIVGIEAEQTYALGGATGEHRSEIERQVEWSLIKALGENIARNGLSQIMKIGVYDAKHFVRGVNCMAARAWVITKPESNPHD